MISVANLEIENVIVASHLGKDIELIKLAKKELNLLKECQRHWKTQEKKL